MPEGWYLSEQDIFLNEDTFTIQLKDAQGHFYSLRKSDLRELKKTVA
jgi:hypothetical protein